MIELTPEEEAWYQEMMKSARLAGLDDACIRDGVTIFFPVRRKPASEQKKEIAPEPREGDKE